MWGQTTDVVQRVAEVAPVTATSSDKSAQTEGPASARSPSWLNMVRRANTGAAVPSGETAQRKADGANARVAQPAEVARAGTASAAAPLPHLDQIQRSFGRHDVSNVRASVGGKAADASEALGARAYAVGDTVGFAEQPDLHTAAHEAAHTVQQRNGVQLAGGIDGGANDPFERHADQVADAVVAGKSAEPILNAHAGSNQAGPSVQRTPQHGGAIGAPTPKGPELEANAAIRVTVYDANNVPIRTWEAVGNWKWGDGPHVVEYSAKLGPRGWIWDNAAGGELVVDSDTHGKGGTPVGQWASKLHAQRIVVHAVDAGAASIVKQPAGTNKPPDTHPLGHATDDKDAGNGKGEAIQPGAKGQGDHVKTQDDGKGTSQAHAPESSGGSGDHSGTGHGTKSSDGGNNAGGGHPQNDQRATGGDAKRANDLKRVDELEKTLDAEPDGDSATPTRGNAKGGGTGGDGYKGGAAHDGKTGKDTSTHGAGPGGEGSKDGGKDEGGGGARDDEGSKSGDKDGFKHGSENGRFGGEGKDGDDGVRGAGAVFGGLAAVPEVLKGAVEIGLTADAADLSGRATDLFKSAAKEAVGKGAANVALSSAAATLRESLAVEARIAAAEQTEAALKKLQSVKKFSSLTRAQKAQFQRIIFWQKQRMFFQAYLKAAQAEKSAVQQALKKATGAEKAALQARHEVAELGEKAAKVEPVAGRLPQNHGLAGEVVPDAKLPKRWRGKGFKFKDTGYPDYLPFAKELPNGKKTIRIEYQGSRTADFAAANEAAFGAGKETPAGWTWHHDEDVGVMMLVPTDLHKATSHTGGVAEFKHSKGLKQYDPSGIDDD
jgi:hypothetical protein